MMRKLPVARACGTLLFAAILGMTSLSAQAQVHFAIGNAGQAPIPIALPDFPGGTPQESELGHNIMSVISADLERSGLFKPIDPKSYIQDAQSLRASPRFGDWRLINAQELVSGGIATQADGSVRIEYLLWDVLASQKMPGLAL